MIGRGRNKLAFQHQNTGAFVQRTVKRSVCIFQCNKPVAARTGVLLIVKQYVFHFRPEYVGNGFS